MPTLFKVSPDIANAGLGWAGLQRYLPIDDMFSAHLLGSAYPNPPAFDSAWWDRVASEATPAYSGGYLTSGPASYLQLPFNANTLLARKTEATMVAVVKVANPPANQVMFVGDYAGDLNQKGLTLGANFAAGTPSYRAFANPGTGGARYALLAPDAHSGNEWEMVAGTWAWNGSADASEIAVVRKSPSLDLRATNTMLNAPGGASQLRIGSGYSGNYTTSCQIAAVLTYDAVKSADELAQIYTGLRAIFLKYAPAVVL